MDNVGKIVINFSPEKVGVRRRKINFDTPQERLGAGVPLTV